MDKSKTIKWLDTSKLGYELFITREDKTKALLLIDHPGHDTKGIDKQLRAKGFVSVDRGLKGPFVTSTLSFLKTLPGVKENFLPEKALEWEPLIGRTVDTPKGFQKIIQKKIIAGSTVYQVYTQHQKALRLIPADEIQNLFPDQAVWSGWQIKNPGDEVQLPDGFELYHFRHPGKMVERIAGKPVAIEGYENVPTFVGKTGNVFTLYSTQSGIPIGAPSGSHQDAVSSAQDYLEEKNCSKEQLADIVDGCPLIPQPGDLPGDKSKVCNGPPDPRDELLDLSWPSPAGIKIVTQRCLLRGEQVYEVEIENSPGNEFHSAESIHNMIKFDKARLAEIEKDTRLSEEQKAVQQMERALYEDTQGFADDLPPFRKERILSTLNKKILYCGQKMTRKDMIRSAVNQGGTVRTDSWFDWDVHDKLEKKYQQLLKTAPTGNENHPKTIEVMALKEQLENKEPNCHEKRLYLNDGTFISIKATTKTGMAYAEHLIALKDKQDEELSMGPA